MTIHAIRHLITPWNRQGLLQGNTDIALLENDAANKEIIDSLKPQLDAVAFDCVVVSPMLRAIQTAKLLGFETFQVDELVTEMSFRQYEGKPKAEMLEEMRGQWQADPMATVLSPELVQLHERIKGFLSKYGNLSQVLLISHGAYVRALNAHIKHGALDTMNQVEFGNGERMVLEWNSPS